MMLNIKTLSDDALWERLPVIAATERTTMAILIEHLVELDERRLAVGRGFPSLYEYCVHALKFSEGEAYRRIRAVRAVRKRPGLLRSLEDGSLTLQSLVLLHPHLDAPYGDEVLRRAVGLGTRAVESMLSEYGTAPISRDSIRFVGMEASSAAAAAAPCPLSFMEAGVSTDETATVAVPPAGPLPESAQEPRKLVRFGFTADEELYRMVRRSQQLMRHKYPDGRLEGIFRDALKLLIEKKDLGVRAAKAAERRAQRSSGRRRSK